MRLLDRRVILQGLGAAGLGSVLGGRAAFAQTPDRIVVPSFGGVNRRAIQDVFVASFVKETGVKVDIQLGSPSQWIGQVEANPTRPPIHIVMASTDVIYEAGEKGLFEKPTPATVPNMVHVPKNIANASAGWAVPFSYATTGIAYHKDRVKNPPKSLAEFVERTAAGEWRASLPAISYLGTPFWIIWSFADIFGGSLENVTPAIDAVKRMRPNTIFWTGVTDFLNHLESGEADIGLYTDGRTYAAYDGGSEWLGFVNPSEGGILTLIAAAKPKNTPDVVWKYVNTTLDPELQGQYAAITKGGVTNSKAKLPDAFKERNIPLSQTRLPPVEMGRHVRTWVEQWNREIGA